MRINIAILVKYILGQRKHKVVLVEKKREDLIR
jgi:hypothetical protein